MSEFDFDPSPAPPAPPKVKKAKIAWGTYGTSAGQFGSPFDKHAAPSAPADLIVLPPLTKDSWTSMDGKARWDSTVALRGPDLVGSNTIKWFTTSIIRHRLSEVMRVGGLVNSALPFVILPAKINRIGPRGYFDCAHFLSHVIEACDWLEISKVSVDADLWFSNVVGERTHYMHAAMQFWKVLSDPFKSTLAWQLLTNYGTDLAAKAAHEAANQQATQTADAQGEATSCLG